MLRFIAALADPVQGRLGVHDLPLLLKHKGQALIMKHQNRLQPRYVLSEQCAKLTMPYGLLQYTDCSPEPHACPGGWCTMSVYLCNESST